MTAPSQSLLTARPTALPVFVALSVTGHVLLVGVWLTVGWLLAGPKVDLEQKPIKASLVRLGKQRDEKLLPRKEEPPPQPKVEKVEEVAVPAPVPQDTAVKIPTKEMQPEKPSEKKEGAKNTKKSLSDAFAKTAKPSKGEELEGREDGDALGDSATQEGERYYGLINAVVHTYYDVSKTIDEKERIRLRAEVALRIGPGGELLAAELTKSSGNSQFDSAVIGAVKKAAPFSPPPEHLRDSLKKSGVALVFTP